MPTGSAELTFDCLGYQRGKRLVRHIFPETIGKLPDGTLIKSRWFGQFYEERKPYSSLFYLAIRHPIGEPQHAIELVVRNSYDC